MNVNPIYEKEAMIARDLQSVNPIYVKEARIARDLQNVNPSYEKTWSAHHFGSVSCLPVEGAVV